jgi:hypothetical protein
MAFGAKVTEHKKALLEHDLFQKCFQFVTYDLIGCRDYFSNNVYPNTFNSVLAFDIFS